MNPYHEDLKMSFLFGSTKSGKTTLCHFLSSNPLTIQRKSVRYIIEASDNTEIGKKIGNTSHSQTASPTYYDSICDFPGLNDTRGEDRNLSTLISFYQELQKFSSVRIVICIEETTITTSNASLFINYTNELIDLLNLTQESLQGLLLVITKASRGFCEELSEIFSESFPECNNVIIEGIKYKRVNIVPFKLPRQNDCNFEFDEENRLEVLGALNGCGMVQSQDIRKRILPHIVAKVSSISKLNATSNIVFSSNRHIGDRLESDNILCIDKDIKLSREGLTIKAPIVIINTDLNNQEKRLIQLRGRKPSINFEGVNIFLNGESLIISTENKITDIEFPDASSKDFDKSSEFFRIESICANSGWVNYMSHNNKFIDLIAYINPAFGTVKVNPEWNIKVVTVDIQLRLFVNECMRSKNNIIKTFKSLKAFKDIDEYLRACRKTHISPIIQDCIKIYLINVPSLFQILLKPTLSKFFSSHQNEMCDLYSIRDILIARYLELINDYLNKKSKVRQSPLNNKAFSKAYRFLNRLDVNVENVNLNSAGVLNEIKRLVHQSEDEVGLKDFYKFYNVLSVSEDKLELFKYQLTGDISIYPNFQAMVSIYQNGNPLKFEEYSFDSKMTVPGFGLTGVTITIGAVADRVLSSGLLGGVIKSNFIGAGAVIAGAAILAADVGISSLLANLRSGYFEGAYCIEGRKLRIDCNITV